ncbi:MAG: peptidoglycan-binding domain-containing protein, partial [Candidatus Paceibacterota bacterium]
CTTFSITTPYPSTGSGPSAPTCSITLTLKLGNTGIQVKCLQQYLNSHNFTVSPTGAGSPGNETTYFGLKTKASVILFQKSKGLTPDGIVGPITRGEMK